MKIISLQFKNINNLKGENTISFVDDPLTSAGIFAITGPTGSGKSTILDVITLALFNRIPRFKDKISKSNIEGLGSVVTHHTDEARAAIQYEIHNRIYTSEWTVSKTRTGNFRDYEMYIYDANGTPLDLKKSEVPAKNEAIIGLKYDQFVKSIILSQGQFSKFLKADKSERGKLLENITGASIYRKISMAAFEKHKSVRAEVDLEKDRLDQIQILNEEQRTALEQSVSTNREIKETLDQELEVLQKSAQVKKELKRLTQALSEKQKSESQLQNEKAQFATKLGQLEKFEQLNPYRADLTRYRDARQKSTQLQDSIEEHEKQLTQSKATLDNTIQEAAQLTQENIARDNFNEVLGKYEKEVNAMVQELAHIQKTGEDIRQRINSKATQARVNLDVKVTPEAASEQLQQQIAAHTSSITSAGLKADVHIDEVAELRKVGQEELNALKGLQQVYEKENSTTAKVKSLTEDLSKFAASEKQYGPLVTKTDQLIRTTKANIALLEKRKQDALLIANLSDHRTQLVSGEPCPLCGALDHPYAEHLPKSDDEIELRIATAKKELHDQEQEFINYNRQYTQSQTSKKLTQNQLQSLNEELKLILKDKQEKIKAYQGKAFIESENIEQSIHNLSNKVDLYAKAEQGIQKKRILADLLSDFEELADTFARYKVEADKLKQKYDGKDVTKSCNALQDAFGKAKTQIATIKNSIQKDQESLAQFKALSQEVEQRLNPKLRTFGFESLTDMEAFMISEEELNTLKSKKDELARKSTALTTEIQTLNQDIAAKEKEDVRKNVTFEALMSILNQKTTERENVIKSIGESTAKLQRDDQEKERIKNKTRELEKLQVRLDKWALLNKLIGEKTGNKFANFAQGLTLQNLLVFANRRLQKLTDRYLLDRPLQDGSLTVIDQYQGNTQRSVTTLSGGESFLISLALALSLSDMASRNVNLDSLFIDEGFGTLDAESLDIAMNTLEKLQTESQKTVGVISHVEALKERIHVQIKLEKNAQGYGNIKIVG